MFAAHRKILAEDRLVEWREGLRREERVLVVTNGCFDLLHAGHVRYLEAARNLGDALLVGLNGDEGVRRLKGPGRPIHAEGDRALVLASLECVDAVCLFGEVRARRFLERVRPDIYVKGGDYTVESLDDGERAAVEGRGGAIRILPLVEGHSTTSVIERMARRTDDPDRDGRR